MKLLYLYPSLAIHGGLERVFIDKMNYLAESNDVYIVTSDQSDHPIVYPLDERVHFLDFQIRFHTQYQYGILRRFKEHRRMSWTYHERLKQFLEDIKPDLIICTTVQEVHPLLRIKGKIPLIVEAHANFSHQDTFLQHLRTIWNNCWVGRADAVVTLTRGDAKRWRMVSNHVHVIPNIVHLNSTGAYSCCLNKRVIFAGRLVEQKGLQELVKIWRIVNRRYPDWHLDVFGNGQMDSMPDINLGVNPPTSNIFKEYLDSSMLVMTSLYEPFGLVLPEAMSCGLPVVAFDCPFGPADIINDGVDGFLIPNRNIETFANAVLKLIENQDLRFSMGQRGIVSSQRYRQNAIMPQWKKIFSSVLVNR